MSLSHGIRVHWNTNEGPIVPATSTVPPAPKPPFRDPAPVWEIHSNDIENPNPFVYVIDNAKTNISIRLTYVYLNKLSNLRDNRRYILPPPSRPRYNPDNVNDIYPTKNASPTNFGHYVPPPSRPPTQFSQGTYSDVHVPPQPQHTSVVPQLAVQYVANIGNRYYAIIPAVPQENQYQYHNQLKPYFWKAGALQEKPSGKYNAKLKKYKAFETKQKFIPYYTVRLLVPTSREVG